jgi:hypothetical protein
MTGGRDDLVAGLGPDGVLGIGVELPELLSGLRHVAPHPAVALSHHDLHHAPDLTNRGRGPLSVQDPVFDGVVLPRELPRLLVEGEDRRRLWGGDVHVAFVLAVRGADEEEVPVGDGGGIRHVVREGAHLLHHVELPDDVAVVRALVLLVGERAVVLAVEEALDVEGEDLAAVRGVVENVLLDERRGADALVGPIVHAAREELVRDHLPEERTVRLVEGEENTLVAGDLLVVERLVVGSDEDLPRRHHRVSVRLRAEPHHPLDVLLGVDVPALGKARHARDHVPRRAPATHRPVPGGSVLAPAETGDDSENSERPDNLFH